MQFRKLVNLCAVFAGLSSELMQPVINTGKLGRVSVKLLCDGLYLASGFCQLQLGSLNRLIDRGQLR